MEALGWGRGPGQGGYSNNTGEGGVKWRWNLKLNRVEPFRSLYVVPEGGIPEELRREYETVKIELAAKRSRKMSRIIRQGRNGTIRKILRKASWSDEEVDEKEALVQAREPKYLEL
ncbi:hypothetical protein ABVK25_002072 [Lepraria finkii]|uniref:Uncharacterized protein n=1 Tax=Lepraria finkii TaxID=1340010 RepID=A0ABR4BIP2_9LECA